MAVVQVSRSSRPSFKTGYARNASESAYPGLWKGLIAAYAPALGWSDVLVPELSGRGPELITTSGTQAPILRRAANVTSGGGNVALFGPSDDTYIQSRSWSPGIGTGPVSMVARYVYRHDSSSKVMRVGR